MSTDFREALVGAMAQAEYEWESQPYDRAALTDAEGWNRARMSAILDALLAHPALIEGLVAMGVLEHFAWMRNADGGGWWSWPVTGEERTERARRNSFAAYRRAPSSPPELSDE